MEPGFTEITRETGMFGDVVVAENDTVRHLYIANGTGCVRQGGVFHEPAAQTVASELTGPGPVATGSYATLLQALLATHKTRHLLMLGLGAGAGITAALCSMPDLKITVVEIDPALVAASFSNYPLLQYYKDQGQLEIKVGDAQRLPALGIDAFDAALVDLFSDQHDLIDGIDMQSIFTPLINSKARIIINYIAPRLHPRVMDFLKKTHTNFGLTLQHGIWLDPMSHEPNPLGNWILSNHKLDPDALKAYTPYPNLEPAATIDLMRKRYKKDTETHYHFSYDENGLNITTLF